MSKKIIVCFLALALSLQLPSSLGAMSNPVVADTRNVVLSLADQTNDADITPPVTALTIMGNSAGGGVYYGAVTLVLTASDDASGVAKTEYSLDNGATWNVYTAEVTLSITKTYFIKYRSTDNANNIESALSKKVLIKEKEDVFPPVTLVELKGTMDNSIYYKSAVEVSLTASSPYGVDYTEYSLDKGSTWQRYKAPFLIKESRIHFVYYRSIDINKNVENTKEMKVLIDFLPPMEPSIEFKPFIWTNKKVTVSIQMGSDSGSGPSRVEYRLGTEGTWSSYVRPFDVVTNKPIYARMIDIAGNYSSEAMERPNIDQTPPTPPSLEVSENGWTVEDVIVRVTSGKDAGSGVLKSQYKVGKAAWKEYGAPFVVSASGITIVKARTIDFAGNHSKESSVTVKIDRTGARVK